jgi:hypothetical protein
LHALPEGAVHSYSAAFLAEAWKCRCTGRAETHNACVTSNCNLGDRGQGAVCPGGFRMWPERGYWNNGEVRTLRAKLFLEHPSSSDRVPLDHLDRASSTWVVPLLSRVSQRLRYRQLIARSVHRRRSRSDLAARQLWNGAAVVESQSFTTDVALDTQVLRAPLFLSWMHHEGWPCMSHAGPYCASCADGYFKRGKICAKCDGDTRSIMYA